MSIENGEQILPTGAFEEFDDFEDQTKAEEDAYENQINEEQELNDKNTARLQGDPDPEDEDEDADVSIDDTADADGDDTSDEETSAETETEDEDEDADADADAVSDEDAKAKTEEAKAQAKVAKDDLSKKEKFERYSRSVQRRINKEVKQREVLRAENDQLRQRLDGIENKLNTEQEQSEVNVLANRIRNATSIKQQLLEDGEYEQVAQVDNDIMQMKIHQSKLEERAQQQAYQQQPQQQQPQPQQQQQQVPQVEVPSIQTQWIKGNKRFGQDQAYTNYINTTYDQMLEEGYDPEREDMYAELDRRIGRKQSVASKPASKLRPTKKRPQSAPTPNVASAQKSSGKTKGLTEADKTNMKNWGLDVTDVDVRKEWLANKRKRA